MLKKMIGPGLFVFCIWACVNFLFQMNFSFLEPVESFFEQFNVKDIYYDKLQNKEVKYDDRIVLIDIDTMSRPAILQTLFSLDSCKPKVIGVDILFPNPRFRDTDSLLAVYANNRHNTIFAVRKTVTDSLRASFFMFPGSTVKQGLVNFGNEGEHLPVRTILNNYSKTPGLHSFVLQIYNQFSEAQQQNNRFDRSNEMEIVYRRLRFPEINAVTFIKDPNSFKHVIADKIVLLGALNDNSDKHFTPYASLLSRGNTDAYYAELPGMKIHAIALSSLMDGSYLRESVFFDDFLLVFLFVLSLYFMVRMMQYHHFYIELISKLYAFVISIVLLILYIFLFDRFSFQFELTQAIFIVILTSEMVILYHPVMAILSGAGKTIARPFKKLSLFLYI